MSDSSEKDKRIEDAENKGYDKAEGWIDITCFGEYGSRVLCQTCVHQLTCKSFTHAKQESIYLKHYKRHKGRGSWTRKDLQ